MLRKPRKIAGLIGLGIIGSRAAAGLRAAGYQTFVWNRTPQPAPNFLATPADVAEVAEIIQIFVADAQALFDVLEALREKLTVNHLIIASGTFGPEATVEASRFVQETGARFLDAPFTGSKAAAERRQLVFYVGGDDASFLRAKPLLEANSKAIIRIGAVGDAAIVKVVTNMISAVSIQALAEALAIVRKAGLPDEVLGAALEHNACRSGAMELKLPKMVSGDYEPHFSLKHMFKDVQLGIQIANALEIDCPAASVTAGAMFGGIKHGWGDLDFAALFKVYENHRAHHHAMEGLNEGQPGLPVEAIAPPAPLSRGEAPPPVPEVSTETTGVAEVLPTGTEPPPAPADEKSFIQAVTLTAPEFAQPLPSPPQAPGDSDAPATPAEPPGQAGASPPVEKHEVQFTPPPVTAGAIVQAPTPVEPPSERRSKRRIPPPLSRGIVSESATTQPLFPPAAVGKPSGGPESSSSSSAAPKAGESEEPKAESFTPADPEGSSASAKVAQESSSSPESSSTGEAAT